MPSQCAASPAMQPGTTGARRMEAVVCSALSHFGSELASEPLASRVGPKGLRTLGTFCAAERAHPSPMGEPIEETATWMRAELRQADQRKATELRSTIPH